MYLTNSLYIYMSCYQKIKDVFLKHTKKNKIQIINNYFCKKKLKFVKQFKSFLNKKSFYENFKLIRKHKITNLKQVLFIETNSFLEFFFISLQKFIPENFSVFVTLEKQNRKLIFFKKKKAVILKRKQKLVSLRKYEQNTFFKEGINILLSFMINENSSKLLAQYISIQLKILKSHNFFIRFIKDLLTILNNKIFFSTIKCVKIKIKGRFNSRPRATSRITQILYSPPIMTQNINISYFEEVSFSVNGTFGIKV